MKTQKAMEKDLSLTYNYAPPAHRAEKGKNPLLILAHGYGADENDLFALAGEFPTTFHIVSPRGPLDLPFGGAAWYSLRYEAERMVSDFEQARRSRDRLAAFIGEAKEKFSSGNVCLLGFSQGAILSYGILSKYPSLVNRYVSLSGYAAQEIMDPSAGKNDYSGVKVLAMHGVADPVIPIEAGRGVQDFLKGLQIDFSYHEYPIGHHISADGLVKIKEFMERI